MRYSKRKIDNAGENLVLFLKVLDFLNKNGEPTEKASGMLMVGDNNELLIIKPKGKRKLEKIINNNFGLLSFISTEPKIKELSVEQIRSKFVTKNILK